MNWIAHSFRMPDGNIKKKVLQFNATDLKSGEECS